MPREFSIRNFTKGLITKIEDFSIPEDAASNSLNWLTLADRIELSGGYQVIGTENGAGKITGLKVGEKVDGTKIAIRTRGQKIETYETSVGDWTEAGSDILGTDADGEDTSIDFYTSLAGYQAWISSPNSGYYKMMLANPGSVTDNYDVAKNFKGFLLSQNGRITLWNRLNNKNYLYGSYKDLQDSSVYTSVSSEAVGSGGTNYSGTLSAISGKITCFNVVFTDDSGTPLVMVDDKNGAFTGDGTGTINYSTGAYNVTFTSTTGTVTVAYDHEDSTASGVADYTFSATRTANQGFFLPQPTGGDLLDMQAYRTEFYCLHQHNAWLFSMPVDDLSPTNQVFRENTGLSGARAAVATGDGIYFIDSSDTAEPRFKLLALQSANDQVVPTEFSFNLDLSGFDFSEGVAQRWGDYILFSGKVTGAAVNNRLFAYHKKYRTFDVLDYQASVLERFGNDLWSGETSTDNVTQLFTGFTANGSNVDNFWEGKLSQLQIDELKKFKRLTLKGFIGTSQSLKVSLAYDKGGFQEIGTIDGNGTYVSSGGGESVGVSMVGSKEVGGGSSGVDANFYTREFRVRSRRFDEVKIRIEATAVGFASVTEINYYDIQVFGKKNLRTYRTT